MAVANVTTGASEYHLAAYVIYDKRERDHVIELVQPESRRVARERRGEYVCGTLGSPTATPLEIMAEAAPYRRARPDLSSPVVHISIALPVEDGVKTPQQWEAMTRRFLELIEFPTHGAYACYRHQDTDKDHIHLLMLKSLGDGSIWDDKWSAKRAIAATEKLEIEFGLQRHSREKNTDQKVPRGEEILTERMAQKGKKLDKQHIREALDAAVSGLGQAYTLAQLRDALALRGVTVDAYTPASAKGAIKGLKFGHDGFHVQAGQLGDGYTAASLFDRGLAKFVDGAHQSVEHERPGQSGPAPTPAPRAKVTPEQAAQARQALDKARGGVKEQFDQAHQAGIAEHLIRMAMAMALLLAKLIEALFGLKPGALGSWEYHPSSGARAVPPKPETLQGVDVAALAQAQARLAVQLNKLTDALKTGDMDKLPDMPDGRFKALREQLAAANRDEGGSGGSEGSGDDEREEPRQLQRREGDHA